jgi:hypothetical protein
LKNDKQGKRKTSCHTGQVANEIMYCNAIALLKQEEQRKSHTMAQPGSKQKIVPIRVD